MKKKRQKRCCFLHVKSRENPILFLNTIIKKASLCISLSLSFAFFFPLFPLFTAPDNKTEKKEEEKKKEKEKEKEEEGDTTRRGASGCSPRSSKSRCGGTRRSSAS